nr:NB-ARC domain-containing protein [Streptomyces scabichelini]
MAVLTPESEAAGTVVVSAVAGLAGIGKTALAKQSAATAVGRGWFPGGAVFVDLHGYAPEPADRLRPVHVFAPMLYALGWEGEVADSAAGQAAQFHRLLTARAEAGRAVLLVLDNASVTEQVAELLPAARRHRVIVTSRHTLTPRGSRPLELGTLPPEQSVDLIRSQVQRWLGHDDGARLERVPGSLARLAELCGNLPLALHIVAALLVGDRTRLPSDLADDLTAARSRLDLLDDGDRAVRAAFDLSYQRLNDNQARQFRLIPLNPGPHLSSTAAAALSGVPGPEGHLLMEQLARAHLVERAGDRRWRQHDLIRAYAVELLDQHGDDQKPVVEQLLAHYVVAAEALAPVAAGVVVPEWATVQEAEQEHPNFMAALSMAVVFGYHDRALALSRVLVPHFERHRHFEEWESVSGYALDTAREVHDRQAEIWALTSLTRAQRAAGRVADADASVRRAVEVFAAMVAYQEQKWRGIQAPGAQREGGTEGGTEGATESVVPERDELRDADTYAEALGGLLEDPAERRRLWDLLLRLAEIALTAGAGDVSDECCRTALDACRRDGHQLGEARALALLGTLSFRALNDTEGAFSAIDAALTLCREQHPEVAGGILVRLAALHNATAQPHAAFEAGLEAVRLMESAGEDPARGAHRSHLGLAHVEMSIALAATLRFEEAFTHAERALQLCLLAQDADGEALALMHSGIAATYLREWHTAYERLSQATRLPLARRDRRLTGQLSRYLTTAQSQIANTHPSTADRTPFWRRRPRRPDGNGI